MLDEVYDLEENRMVVEYDPKATRGLTDAEIDLMIGLKYSRRIHPKCGQVAHALVKRGLAQKIAPAHYFLTARGLRRVNRMLGGA